MPIQVVALAVAKRSKPRVASKPTPRFRALLAEVRGCPLCAKHLPLGPRPVLQIDPRARLLASLPNLEVTLVIGQYAQEYHLGAAQKASLTETVRAWREFWPALLPIPHPSPRNNIWLRKNPWFESDVLPRLRKRMRALDLAG